MSSKNNKGSISKVKNRAQNFLGLRRTYQFSEPDFASANVVQPEPAHEHQADDPVADQAITDAPFIERTEFRTRKSTALPAGWYMLEVVGSSSTIGANLTVRGVSPADNTESWSDIANIQLGSHSHSKRLVRLQNEVAEIRLRVDGVYPIENAPLPTFVRVTSAFAVDRMCKKLTFGSVLGHSEAALIERCRNHAGDEDVEALYRSYRSLMERHVTPVEYADWLASRSRGDGNGISQEGISTIGRSAITAIGHKISEFDETVIMDSLAAEPTQRVDGLTPAYDEYATDNPSLCVYLVNATESGNLAGNVARAVARLIEHARCDIRVMIPSTLDDYDLQRLVANNVSNLEIVHYSPRAESSELDEWFLLHLADMQVFVEGDAQLDPMCLLTFWELFRQQPDLELAFSDNDSIDEFGRRNYPVFKPEWNPELLLNGNYIGSVAMFSRDVVSATGGWQHRYGNSAMFDLLLRSGEYLQPGGVVRIPDILWHQRLDDVPPAAALDTGYRDELVLYDYFAARSPAQTDEFLPNFNVTAGLLPGALRIERNLGFSSVPVDILIPSKDKVELLSTCIQSILEKTEYPDFVITIIDNGSTEAETAAYYAEITRHPAVSVLEHTGEFNFSAMNNEAVHFSNADVVVMLNNDTEVISSEWLREMVNHAVRPSVGCVGAKLYYTNGCIQHGGVIVGLKGMAGHAHRFLARDADGYCGRLKLTQNVTAVTAACLAIRRDVYLEVGGLDEVNLKVAYNDVDFCLRVAAAGYRNLWTPYAELYHHESVSRGSDDTPEKRKRFLSEFDYMKRRWKTDEWQDAAYNPNLAQDMEDFSLSINASV